MSVSVPRVLNFNGRQFHLSGRGAVQGSYSFLDHATGRQADFFVVEIFQTGSLFSLCQVIGPSMPAVKVDHSILSGGVFAGERLLVGPLIWPASGAVSGPSAQFAVRLSAGGPPRPQFRVPRWSGVITHVHQTGSYGHIRRANGTDIFVHVSDCRPGILRVGTAVQFNVENTPRGEKATGVTAI